MRNKYIIAMIFAATSVYAQSDEVKIPTRFGELKTNEDGFFQFKGKIVSSSINITSEAYVLANYKLSNSDVILVSQAAGSSCPGMFAYITVSKEGVKVTPVFGTCYDDDVKPVQDGDTLTFNMKNVGKKGSSKYVYEKGFVLENGKPVK